MSDIRILKTADCELPSANLIKTEIEELKGEMNGTRAGRKAA